MIKALLFGALLAGVAVSAQAQQNSFDGQVANTALLHVPAVQIELAITPQQSKAIAKAASSQSGAMEKARRDRKALVAIRAQIRQAELAQISAAQLLRLREISLQEAGPQALLLPSVANRLSLDNAQRSLISSIFATSAKNAMEALKKATEMYSKGSKDPQEAAMKAQQSVNFEEIRRSAGMRALTVLNDRQRAAWEKLLGKPFRTAVGPVISGGGTQP